MDMLTNMDTEVSRSDRGDEVGGWDIRLLPDRLGVEPQKEMSHRRISCDHQMRNQRTINVAHFEKLLNNSVDRRDDHFLKLLEPSWPLRIDNSGNDVFAVANLCVVIGCLGQGEERCPVTLTIRAGDNDTPTEVQELAEDGRRSNVENDRVVLAGRIPRFNIDKFVSFFSSRQGWPLPSNRLGEECVPAS